LKTNENLIETTRNQKELRGQRFCHGPNKTSLDPEGWQPNAAPTIAVIIGPQ